MCREFTLKSHTEQSPNIFRDYDPKRNKEDVQFDDDSSCAAFPCIKPATALEYFEDNDDDEDGGFFRPLHEDEKIVNNNNNNNTGTFSLYENDRVGRCDEGDEGVSSANAEWLLSPKRPFLASTRLDEPPSLAKSIGDEVEAEDSFALPLFLQLPAGHTPFRSKKESSIITGSRTNGESVVRESVRSFRLAPRPVTSRYTSKKTLVPSDRCIISQEKKENADFSNLMLPLF